MLFEVVSPTICKLRKNSMTIKLIKKTKHGTIAVRYDRLFLTNWEGGEGGHSLYKDATGCP